jgi:acetyltransferase-like isoleucine patch superfamily enzyme
MKTLRMAWFVAATAALSMLPHPRWRAWWLRCLGAEVGRGVRVHPCRFINHEMGFANLRLGEGVYLGADCLLDLAGPLEVGARATISARCVLITHVDPGQSHGNALVRWYPPSRRGCRVGSDAWLGVAVLVLETGEVGAGSIVGAGAVVTGPLPPGYLCVGQPARALRTLSDAI